MMTNCKKKKKVNDCYMFIIITTENILSKFFNILFYIKICTNNNVNVSSPHV